MAKFRVRPAVLLVLSFFAGTALGQTQQDQAQRIPVAPDQQSSVQQASHAAAIYLPSPFAEDGQLTAMPGFEGSPSPGQTGSVVAASADSQSVKWPSSSFLEGGKQICIESWTLTLNEAAHKKMIESFAAGTLQLAGGEIRSARLDDEPSADGIVCETSALRASPTLFGQISEGDFDAVLDAVKSDARSNVTMAPRMTCFENQVGTAVSGSVRPFVVGVAEHKGDFDDKTANVPQIQLIEEGVIARHKASLTEDGVHLDSHIILNQIEAVDEFTFKGKSAEPVTIQLPRCDCKQLRCSVNIAEGNLLMIDPNFEQIREVRKESKMLLFKNVSLGREKVKTVFLLKATVLEDSEGSKAGK